MTGQLIRAALASVLACATSAAQADVQAGRAKARTCAVCHGEFGISLLPNAPNLAGQPETYLAEQLKAYRSGKRANEIMSVIAKPLTSTGIRNEEYKLVSNFNQAWDATDNTCVPTTTDEFYKIDEAVPAPRLDRENENLLLLPKLTPEQKKNYDALRKELAAILDSQPTCPGDGNIDGVVNGNDLADYNALRTLAQGKSSWYDFNLDGLTDSNDLTVIQQNLGTKCKK